MMWILFGVSLGGCYAFIERKVMLKLVLMCIGSCVVAA